LLAVCPGGRPVSHAALIRARLQELACAAATGAEALDAAALDLPEGTLAQLTAELDGLAGRLDRVLDRLGAGVDPARASATTEG
jgi:hypothetical protein